MKKGIICIALASLLITLVSWGFQGHRAVGLIAQNHLTPQAQAGIKELLGNESLADVAPWADEVRNEPQYSYTAPWHFLNADPGMSYPQFVSFVKSSPKESLYTAINKCIADLKSQTTAKEQKVFALKFLIHLVGDAYQPMHVSRAEDKGGNTIQVQFDGKGTNLHTLWDSRLIDHEALSESQLVAKLEERNKRSDIGAYQTGEITRWLWESYSISTKLYDEVAKNNKLDEGYYTSHISLVEERLLAGGLRLAGVLNDIFAKGLVASPVIEISKDTTTYKAAEPVTRITLKDIGKFMNKMVSVEGKVYSSRDMGNMVLVNLGAAYPNQLLTLVLRGEAKPKPADIDGKIVQVIGTLIEYKGKPEIIVTDAKNFSVIEKVGDTLDHGSSGG
jgi:hypothetical protein